MIRQNGAILQRRQTRAVAFYALATFGVHLAYAPLLSLLLPRRIVSIAPDHAAVTTSLVVLIGAVTASLAHILAGWFSDGWRRRHGNRRAPIALGLVLTVVALAGLGVARQVSTIIVGLVVFQCALNLLFGPLGALLIDHFADRAKGRVAALTNLAMPLASLGTGAVALAFPNHGAFSNNGAFSNQGAMPFVAIAVVVGMSVAPLVIAWPFAQAEREPVVNKAGLPRSVQHRADLVRAGCARALVQAGAAFVMTYFYLFLVRHPARAGLLPGQSTDVLYGRLVVTSTIVVLVVTMLAGHWSDRRGRRRAPMIAGALVTALALMLLQGGNGWVLLVGYGLFQAGLIAYLALDAALVAQLLHGHARPGEVLGYMNLANTAPSILVPLIVLMVSGGTADALWRPGFTAAAVCCVVAALLVARIRTMA